MEDQYVETVLGRIHLRVGGEGPAVVCWPSLLMDGTLWNAQAAYFADRFRVILVDPPGHGGSSPLTREFSFTECAQVVVQILDALGIDRAHLLGSSSDRRP
jgi:3-oxoadipate enol-lactonase